MAAGQKFLVGLNTHKKIHTILLSNTNSKTILLCSKQFMGEAWPPIIFSQGKGPSQPPTHPPSISRFRRPCDFEVIPQFEILIEASVTVYYLKTKPVFDRLHKGLFSIVIIIN